MLRKKSYYFYYTLIILILFLFLEFSAYVFSKLGLLFFNHPPKIYRADDNLYGMEWLNEKEEWGAWHKKNVISKHISNCFNVTYKSNSIGLRGEEVNLASKRNIFLIGDSFAEGWGVNREETLQHLLETEFSSQVLNLGISGDVGPLQYYLIYKNLLNLLN